MPYIHVQVDLDSAKDTAKGSLSRTPRRISAQLDDEAVKPMTTRLRASILAMSIPLIAFLCVIVVACWWLGHKADRERTNLMPLLQNERVSERAMKTIRRICRYFRLFMTPKLSFVAFKKIKPAESVL